MITYNITQRLFLRCIFLVNKTNDFVWTDDHDHAFNKTIEVLTTAPVLTFPSPEGLFILDTDASHDTTGSVLSKLQEGQERLYVTLVTRY